MKLVKSLLLASAAGLAGVAGAQAADLPMVKAAPVEYVRVCSAYGTGFFYIPGTETCLRIQGRVRAEYRYEEPQTRAQDAIGWRARGRIQLDARTQTAYGLLRTFIRFEPTLNSGIYSSYTSGVGSPVEASGAWLNKAFVQFGGLTAGRATSFFDFYANDLNWGGLPTGSDTYGNDPVVLAYTATFGSGFSATISIEDPASRRIVGSRDPNFAYFDPITGLTYTGSRLDYAGQRMPEVVANLRVDQAWGSAQLAGAVHQQITLDREPLTGNYADTDYGFAIMAGAKINMPFLAPGDLLWLQATYAQGAVNYLGVGSSVGLRTINTSVSDAYVDAFGNVKSTEGWVLAAAFLHYWTPQIRQGIFGSYGRIENAATVSTVLPASGFYANASITDMNFWFVGTNVTWSPVSGLDIGVEVDYKVVDPSGRYVDPTRAVATGVVPYTLGRDDSIEARLRVQRDF